MNGKKILIVSYYYSPEENPRVFRWSSIVSHWLSCGYEISLITASQDKYGSKTQDCLNIIRVPENLIGKIRYKISRTNTLRAEIGDTELSMPGNALVISKWIKGLYSFVIKRLQWPDFALDMDSKCT